MGSKLRQFFQWFVVLAACVHPMGALAASPAPKEPQSVGPVVNHEAEIREIGAGAQLAIAPGALISDGGTVRLPAAGSAGGTVPVAIFAIESGRVDVVIDGAVAERQAILIRGPRETAILTRRGHSAVVVDGSQIAVAAYGGPVNIVTGSSWINLSVGERWVSDTQTPGGVKGPLIAAPAVTLRTPIHISTPGAVGQVRVVVKPVSYASSFVVGAIPVGDTSVRPRLFASAISDVMVRGLPPGSYALQARAVDSFGLEGLPAPFVPFRVIGVRLPLGAYSRNGTPILANGQLLELTHAEGLELTYDKADFFIPVPPAVGLRRGRPVLVRIREPGSDVEAKLLIEPRRYESSIVMTPNNAVWPRDEVRISVDISEVAAGGEDWQALSVLLRTTLNDELLAPEWRCQETSCRTVIRPLTTPGPWVLRVEMVDDQGELVGRNFLEIADERRPDHSRTD